MSMIYLNNLVSMCVPADSYAAGNYNFNATNEMGAIIGRLHIEGGPGLSKTLSAAGGGSIVISNASSTFVTAPSEFRVGLEDINATGLADGTQDAYGSKIAGAATISANSYQRFIMTNGTKTVTHGDLLAITCRMTARAGADVVNVSAFQWNGSGTNPVSLPYGLANGAKTTNLLLWAVIRFDDGTLGWIQGQQMQTFIPSVTNTFNSGSTPDEYCSIFQVPAKINIEYIGQIVNDTAATDDFEIILYSDPLVSPIIIETISLEPDRHTGNSTAPGLISAKLSSIKTLEVGTIYGISIRPITAGNITSYYFSLGSGFDDVKRVIPFFTNVKVGVRTNLTGPFVETQPYHLPYFSIGIVGFDDGTGSGSGAAIPSSYAFVG